MKFHKCGHCGNVVGLVVPMGVPLMCCGQRMAELVPNSTDAAAGKHIPVVTTEGGNIQVRIGEQEHPMLSEHRIEFIYLQTEQGGQRKSQKIGQKPEAAFALAGGDKPIAVYEYCNLHGLWKTDLV